MIATRGVRLELTDSKVEDHSRVLASVSFGAERGQVCGDTGAISIPMPRLDGSTLVEVWRSEEPVERISKGGFVISKAGDLLIGATVAHDSVDLRERAAAIYRSAVAVAREEGFPRIARMWNHFPEIHGQEDGLERYKAFCAGRAEGFESAGFALGSDLPAASGVGTDGAGLLVMFVATRGPVRNVENPRQVSAFRYPPRYGPRSPSFARASIAELGGESQLFVSGTASIVGCESRHIGHLEMQFRETAENLRAVCELASDGRYPTLESLPQVIYRAYVRHPADYAPLRTMFDEVAGPSARSVWVRGDICREELLLEIELWTRL